MNSSILALRAISAVTFQRVFIPIAWVIGIICVVLIGLTIYLGGWASAWWFFLLILLVPLIVIIAALGATVWYLSNRLLPRPLTKDERRTVQAAADTIMRLAEVRATPWPLLAFRIGKDVLRGRGSRYLESLMDDTTGLRQHFQQVRALFEKKPLA